MRYLFVEQSLDGKFVQSIRELMKGRNDCEYFTGDVKAIISEKTAYITAANSLFFMDSGLDKVYTREMFPGTERIFRDIVKKHGQTSLVGKPYIPIGDAIMINPEPNKYLIGAPTMLMPQAVRSTRNAYHSTLAALYLCMMLSDITVVIPAMCCGWGKMSPAEAAKQVWWAILDSEAGIGRGQIQRVEKGALYRSQRNTMAEQPLFYENTEFKEIPSHLITTDRS